MDRHRLGSYYQYRADRLTDTPVLVHVGATSDRFATAWVQRHGGVAYGVQADIDVCRQMRRQNVLHAALSPQCGLQRFHRFTHRTASSVWPLHDTQGRVLDRSMWVAGVTLKTMAESLGCIDLLLCNCEGAEKFALQDLADDVVASRVPQACIATHWRHVPIYTKDDLAHWLEPLRAHYDIESVVTQNFEYLVMCHV